MQETQVWFLGREDPLEKGTATYSSTLAWRIPWLYSPWAAESDVTEQLSLSLLGFPGSSVGKESACNAGDHGWIPGSGRSAREGIGYQLQYSWDSLVAQLVKNLPAKWETWVWSLGWEDPLEKGKATHSSTLAWRSPWTEEPGRLQFMQSQSDTT